MKSDSEPSSHGEHYTTEQGEQITWLDAAYFEQDGAAGHGTHTAGSAAGATLNTPAEAVTCSIPDVLGCVGACISDSSAYDDDDLLTYYDPSHSADLDRLCPSFDCGEYGEEVCLSEDVEQTLADHGGMAQGAKLAIFDMFYGEVGLGSFAGNGVWEACLEAGCKVHSNSYGADLLCEMSELDLEYDDFMYNVSALFHAASASTTWLGYHVHPYAIKAATNTSSDTLSHAVPNCNVGRNSLRRRTSELFLSPCFRSLDKVIKRPRVQSAMRLDIVLHPFCHGEQGVKGTNLFEAAIATLP